MEQQAKQMARILRVLANENRLLILCALRNGPMTVAALREETPKITQSALSQHLSLLRASGILDCFRTGQNVTYTIADPKIGAVIAALQKHYCREAEI